MSESPERRLYEVGIEEVPVRPRQYDAGGAGAKAQPSDAGSLASFRASELAGSPTPPRQFHVEGLIPAKTVTMLNGDGGTGKSLLAKQLCVSTVLGTTWLGMPVRKGTALFITAEDDRDEVHRRLEDIAQDVDVRLEELDDLHIVSLAGADAVLASEGMKRKLHPTRLFHDLKALIAKLRPLLVGLDTLADFFDGDEIRRAHARQFIGMLHGLAIEFECCILLLAHPSLSGMASGSGTSGSTAWSNSVRSRLYLERVKDERNIEHDADARVLKTMKANYSAIGTEIRMRWQRGVFVASQPAHAPSGLTLAAARQIADQVFLDLLTTYEAENRPVSPNSSVTYAPVVFAKDPRSQGIGKPGLTDAMNRLFASHRIEVVVTGPPSRQRQRVVVVRSTEQAT
jgi:RecA-family ATPase